MGFGQGLSGIDAAAQNLDVIGNNIANANTVGFKQSSVQFADVFAGAQVGLGTRVSKVVQSFNQGNITSTGRSLDVAITNGSGFFRLQDAAGQVYYSRNGQFLSTADGHLTNGQGLMLTGYPPGVTAGAGVQPQPLVVPNAQMAPKATTSVAVQLNLDSGSTVITPATFPASGTIPPASSFNYATTLQVYDSLGNPKQLTAYFVKQPVVAGPPPTSPWTMSVRDATGNEVATNTVSFDASGNMIPVAPGGPALANAITIPDTTLNNGATTLTATIDLTGSTQYSGDNDPKGITQNGYASGTLLGYQIQNDGTILASYSNQQTKSLGQVVLAGFGNPEGLKAAGDNVWTATNSSGTALLNAPGSSLGQLKSNAVESSNVNLSSELVNLIVAQRNYQANAQTIKAQDQVMQTLMNI
jgi:flagellar hook protein FlgE